MLILHPFFSRALSVKTAKEPPLEWMDPFTGHRVVRLSQEQGSQSLYFHQNAFTASGDKMVFYGRHGLFTVDLKTQKVELLTAGKVSHVVVGKKNRQAYYLEGNTIYAHHFDTKERCAITEIPEEWTWGSGFTVNADETLLSGTTTEGGRKFTETMSRRQWFDAIFEAHLPTMIYTVDIKTGKAEVIHSGRDWFNHIQFSPTDPGLIMYCHEGPWQKLDRIWTIRINGSDLKKTHERTMKMEIVGHEFWNPDGKIIWYDQQTPKGKEFWLGGTVLATGEKLRYQIDRDQWSVHYNVSRDGKVFAGDGSGPHMMARAKGGKWIYLFRPQGKELKWERLVNMTKHDYRLEPNVMFTPDGNWVVYRSNMHGNPHVYAVEVSKEALL